ncbi:cytochrome P450 [Macrolepiota fuliginosa MF-IS2]|uniref:Cytochrome P450 n=1 Tax=Macrolepiota fuliginosa MF-IS2 TaxID=1400762 RepID=A0A9P6BZC8_9AGAR|nr:cytochrome P450 [Macrolepiota fuliginosa MF-IS2]
MVILSLRDILCLFFCIFIHYIYRYRRKPTFPYPPGPRRWPIIGNALSIPLTYMHVFYKDLGDRLGTKIIYMEALGQPIIVLNDIRIAKDLLENRSSLYSSRPLLPMLTEMVFCQIFIKPQKTYWNTYESMVYYPCMGNLELPLINSSCTGGYSTSLTYGLPTRRHKDPLLLFAEDIFARFTLASAPGNFLVNVIPQLNYIPSWMPGASFKRVARQLHDGLYKLMEEPYQATQKNMDEGTLSACFVLENLERTRHTEDYHTQHKITKQVAAQIYAGSEITHMKC